ncbi:hypothetical protein JD844_009889 [Phrynosoma platyrhinos]|uniref:Uncharacterized protein n=1 Tax=Phrynosoma platyrhinos TaxID=52577 RepID=A0ABQ7TFX2_PHRPL|nr:hypothetical protein JD844_009889 [Phrynosoma platyrhinos]
MESSGRRGLEGSCDVTNPEVVLLWPRGSGGGESGGSRYVCVYNVVGSAARPWSRPRGDSMAAEVKVTGQNQEQFLLLAKSARGAALASLIHQVLEAPGIYVFGELLDMPNVREVSPNTRENTVLLQLADSEFSPVFRLLTVFAYGTYSDYLGMFPLILRKQE